MKAKLFYQSKHTLQTRPTLGSCDLGNKHDTPYPVYSIAVLNNTNSDGWQTNGIVTSGIFRCR